MQIQTQEKIHADDRSSAFLSVWSHLLSPLRQSRLFTLMWIGHWIAMLGSSITMVIIPVVVYSITGSAMAMGLGMTVYMLSNVLVLPLSGWIVDRMDRVRVILFTNAVRLLLMIAAAAMMFAGSLTLSFVYLGLAVYGLMDGIFNPAYSAFRAQVFTPDIRNAANALSQISVQAVRLMGPAIGGVIVSVASAGVGFGLDSLAYLISFVCFWMLGKRFVGRTSTSSSKERSSSRFSSELMEGFAVLKSHPWLWITILAFSLINICYSGIIMVLVPWLFKVHHGYSPFVYGLAMAGSGAGAILGAFLYGSKRNWNRRGLIAYGGAFLSGLALLLLSLVSWPPLLIVMMVIEGFGIMLFSIVWETSLQELVPEEAFGRVVSLDMLGSWALLPAGYLAVGALADKIGGTLTMSLFASLGMMIVAAVLCVSHIRRFD